MFRTNSEVGGFHTKGYIFREDELYRIIIGSSNMTSSAITKIENGIQRLFLQNKEKLHKKF